MLRLCVCWCFTYNIFESEAIFRDADGSPTRALFSSIFVRPRNTLTLKSSAICPLGIVAAMPFSDLVFERTPSQRLDEQFRVAFGSLRSRCLVYAVAPFSCDGFSIFWIHCADSWWKAIVAHGSAGLPKRDLHFLFASRSPKQFAQLLEVVKQVAMARQARTPTDPQSLRSQHRGWPDDRRQVLPRDCLRKRRRSVGRPVLRFGLT